MGVFKEGFDPQHNTAVQRSWMYQPDPMLKGKYEGMPAETPFATPVIPPRNNMSPKSAVAVSEDGRIIYNNEQNVKYATSITLTPSQGFNPSKNNTRVRCVSSTGEVEKSERALFFNPAEPTHHASLRSPRHPERWQ